MSRKAVFFDIDGTLFDFKTGVPESTKTSIEQLRENGTYAFISTGRSRAFISDKDILNIGFDGMIAACGTYITYHGKVLMEQLLDHELINKTLELLRKHEIFPVFEGSENLYFDKENYKEQDVIDWIFKEQLLQGKIKSITGHERDCKINKMTLHLNGEDDLEKIIKPLENFYDYVYHKPEYLELMPKGFNKGSGIKYLCDYLKINIEDTYAFGDSSNDLDMFRTVRHSVCMGNGTDDAKRTADYVTDNIEDNGIYNGLKHLRLL